MALSKQDRTDVIKKYSRSNADTGSSEVQIALLTARINSLSGHVQANKQDVHSRHGLMNLVNKRRKLLDYLKRIDLAKYQNLIQELGVRK